MNRWRTAAILGVLASCIITHATTFLQIESAYLGDGLFSYRLNLLNDPFVGEALVNSFGFTVTNLATTGAPPTDWTNSVTQIDWNYALTNRWQDRPYERTFYAYSNERTYRFATYGCVITFSLYPREITDGQWFYTSGDIVGYAQLPCLVPCPPDQADSSPPDYEYDWKIVPDIQMGPLILTNGRPFGINYYWPASGLVEVQSTFDFQNWSPVTRINGTSGTNTWTTNSPIDASGSNFRVQLISGNLFGSTVLTKPTVSNLRCTPNGRTVTIDFTATTDGPYLVEARTLQHQVIASKTAIVTAGKGTASFTSDGLPTPVTFTAKQQ
jgi:hypothetical protein